MKIEVAQHARMSERGSSLLRLIQNNEMPVLDLLVRESVQNSLDASRREAGHVNVQFNVTEFDSEALNEHFEGITASLNERFPKGSYRLLEIKDSNTVGLTGPLHYKQVKNNNFGNLLKLVYEISMPQQQEGAGGSWGLGKTVYFRLGIGLVLYYSRIRNEEGGYESRLAACLVEDENRSDCLLKPEDEQPQRGIAWWGRYADSESTMPVTDENEIASILSSFNVSLYEGEETGTTIVIPYLDEEKLLEETIIIEDKEKALTPVWWTKSIQDYLRVSLQRWYAPRLMNNKYKYGDWLRASVNGRGISQQDMLPFFRVIQELYNKAASSSDSGEQAEIFGGAEVHQRSVFLRGKTFKSTGLAGKAAYTKLKRSQLKMTAPDNHPSPFIQISNSEAEADFNPPVVAYARKPGMIVGYETAGHWTDGIPKTAPDEYIVAVFAANSENILNTEKPEDEMTLEEYIRKGEKADHTSWNDWNLEGYRTSIVARIQQQTRKSVAESYIKKTEETSGTRSIGLARTLAEILLPPENFGKKPVGPGQNPGGPGGGNPKGKNPSLELGAAEYLNGNLKMGFVLNTGKKSDTVHLRLRVVAEAKDIMAEEWESEDLFGARFPFELLECSVDRVEANSKTQPQIDGAFVIGTGDKEADQLGIKVSKLYSSRHNVCYGLEFHTSESKGYTIHGSLSFKKENSDVKAGINVIAIEGGES